MHQCEAVRSGIACLTHTHTNTRTALLTRDESNCRSVACVRDWGWQVPRQAAASHAACKLKVLYDSPKSGLYELFGQVVEGLANRCMQTPGGIIYRVLVSSMRCKGAARPALSGPGRQESRNVDSEFPDINFRYCIGNNGKTPSYHKSGYC